MRIHCLALIAVLAAAAGTAPLAADEAVVGKELLASVNTSSVLTPSAAGRERRRPKNEPFELLGETIPPGAYRQLAWAATELFEGLPVETPVLAVNGAAPGPVLCLTAAIHGDELNGIEIVRRVLHGLQPSELAGTVVGVPIVNIQGFRRGSRYLPDRRDLNRYFPGSPGGSAASRIAHSFFNNLVIHCDALVDLHTGSFERANLPQLRADLNDPSVEELAISFGATVIVNSQPRVGTLRYAATHAGIPTVTLEAGGPERLEPREVSHGVRGIETLLHRLQMTVEASPWESDEATYLYSSWVRADHGGILMSSVELGSSVEQGDLLGRVTDPITNETAGIYAPNAGRIIGMARNQIVMPGFATYHLGSLHPAEPLQLAPPVPDDDASDNSE